MSDAMGARCRATKRDGTPCRAWAVRGSNPPHCSAHGGSSSVAGGPTEDQAAGAPDSADLSARIDDLDRRIRQLSDYIDAHLAELAPGEFARLTALQGQLSSRLGRLMRDRQAIAGDQGDELQQAVNQALDQLSQEWGIEL